MGIKFQFIPKTIPKITTALTNTDIMLGCTCSTQVSGANSPPSPLLPRGKKDIILIVRHPPQWAKFLKLQIPIDTFNLFNLI